MNITVKYDVLLSTLGSMSFVVEDTLNSEEMKCVIFSVTNDKRVKLVGINQFVVYKAFIPEEACTVEADDNEFDETGNFYMQVKSKELTGFLSTFKSVRRTKVDSVSITLEQGKVKMTVKEVNTTTEDVYTSAWRFDNIPIKQTILKTISIEMPENMEELETDKLALYTTSSLPIMQNTTTLMGRLQFGEDKRTDSGEVIESRAVAFTPAFNTIMRNELPAQFKGVAFCYRAVNFMKTVICHHDNVSVAKTDQYMCFNGKGKFEAYVRYLTQISDYTPYLNMFSREHAVMLDRPYFKDVLKRLSLVDEQIFVTIENDVMSVKNTKFSQDIPILQSKNMDELGVVSFKIKPEVLSKAIIGSDSDFSNSLFFYISKLEKGGWSLIFSDDSDFWFSVARIR